MTRRSCEYCSASDEPPPATMLAARTRRASPGRPLCGEALPADDSTCIKSNRCLTEADRIDAQKIASSLHVGPALRDSGSAQSHPSGSSSSSAPRSSPRLDRDAPSGRGLEPRVAQPRFAEASTPIGPRREPSRSARRRASLARQWLSSGVERGSVPRVVVRRRGAPLARRYHTAHLGRKGSAGPRV